MIKPVTTTDLLLSELVRLVGVQIGQNEQLIELLSKEVPKDGSVQIVKGVETPTSSNKKGK